ncbi:unnamed protein product [Arctogadus glacialis]
MVVQFPKGAEVEEHGCEPQLQLFLRMFTRTLPLLSQLGRIMQCQSALNKNEMQKLLDLLTMDKGPSVDVSIMVVASICSRG